MYLNEERVARAPSENIQKMKKMMKKNLTNLIQDLCKCVFHSIPCISRSCSRLVLRKRMVFSEPNEDCQLGATHYGAWK